MIINIRRNLKFLILALGFLVTPLMAFAFDANHHNHGVKVETMDSNEAYLTKIHAQNTETGVEIVGTLKRKGHKNRRLHGYIIIEVVSKDGTMIDTKTLKLNNKSGPAKHDHYRKFSTTMMSPKINKFHVRIRHSILNLNE